jgi:hypothetical protein
MTTHTLPTGTMPAALVASGVASALAFDFALIDRLKNVHVRELGTGLLSRTAFAVDAYINMAIQRAMSKLRADRELAGEAPWDTYQAFLSFVSGIAANEALMEEAGMEITPLRETVQKLFNVRTEIHNILLERIGVSYEIPVITEWMANPRLRRDDPSTMAKRALTNRMLATDPDTGIIDTDLEKQLAASMAIKDASLKADQLKWDKQRGELAALMFDALHIRDDQADAAFDGEYDPFGDLDLEHQFKLLGGVTRYITGVLDDIARDRKITYEVHAAAVKEAMPLRKEVKAAMEHSRFKNVPR